MARPRKSSAPSLANASTLTAWAETLGEALARGVTRGINSGLSITGLGANILGPRPGLGRRRP